MFKTEAHLHTYPVSSCAKLSPREMVRLHKEAGYDTVFVSDHFAHHHFKKLGDGLTFAQKVGLLYGAYLEAKDEGEKLGMHVLFSVELSLHGNHYLLYGVTKEFLLLREDIFDISLDEFYRHAKAHGITIIQAHPYRDGKCTPHPHHVDGFEGINANQRHENFNDRAQAIAREYGLPVTCGSDAHRPEDVGASATLSDEVITSVEQYLSLLRSGKLKFSVNGETV
ncbi:MAG: PHP domain-containing protein [Eubacteriales bacterium]